MVFSRGISWMMPRPMMFEEANDPYQACSVLGADNQHSLNRHGPASFRRSHE